MIPGYGTMAAVQVLLANFERVYPNITVDVTYPTSSTQATQLELTELGAGDAPDLLVTFPGSGAPNGVTELARAEDLTAMIRVPWAKRSLPLVTSLDKYGQGLFAFLPTVSPYGVFTNDALFSKLKLKIPQTLSQLLGLCQAARADGTVAIDIGGSGGTSLSNLIQDFAAANVYGQDKQWTAALKAGKASFEGTPGWQKSLQEVIDMNNAGCFETGMAGTASASAEAEFAQGGA